MLLDHVTQSGKRSRPQNIRFHFQSVHFMDRSTLVYICFRLGPSAAPHATSLALPPQRSWPLQRHWPCHGNVPGPCNGPWYQCNVTNPAPDRSWYLCNVTNPAPERSWYLFNVTNPALERSWYLLNVTNPALERSWFLFNVTDHAPERSWSPFNVTNHALGTILVPDQRHKSCHGTIRSTAGKKYCR